MRDPVDWPTRDLVAHRAEATPDRTALVDADTGRERTYRDLDGAVETMAGRLRAAGVAPGDRLGLLLDTRPAFVELVHAAMRLGVTLVPLNAALTTTELRPQVDPAAVERVVCEAATAEAAADLPAATLSVDGSGDAAVPDIRALEAFDPGAVPDRQLDPDETQVVMFTSGTTGDPKGVRLTTRNLLASAEASAYRLGVHRDDRWLVCLPMYHMGGLAPVLRSALYGTTVVLQREFAAEATGQVVADRDVTGVSLVPTMLTRLLDSGWRPPEHLRFVLLGGAPTPESLVRRCEALGVPVNPTYGMTETASQVATATPAQAFEHGDTVGQPLVVTDVTVVDEGTPVDPGETGELVVDGPTVTPGYLDDERTATAFGDAGLHTGDLGYRDEAGRLFVLGRLDDTVVTGGENVHPGEVAAAIREHPAVADVAVVGLPDDEWGERVAALVAPDAAVAADLDVDLVESHCRERLASFKVPKTWGVADELPRTASGTVDREAVRERLADGVE